MPTTREHHSAAPATGLSLWLALCLFLAIGGFFLWEEHRAHILRVVPYVLLLLCPAIHLFMHRGHAHHPLPGGSIRDRTDTDGRPS